MIFRRVAALLLALGAAPAWSATFSFVFADGPGEGFNDPTPAAPVNGNEGTTLGEQRRNVFAAAAARWGALLASDVTIVVEATFDPLFCTQDAATLGSASTAGTVANFGAGDPNIAYHAALADALAGSDVSGAPDLRAFFNSDLDDDPDCFGGEGWYYGLEEQPDGVPGTPLFPTVLHEFAHGLGFSARITLGTGEFDTAGGFPDPFSRNLFDVDDNLSWDAMSEGQRVASAADDPNLVWSGVNAGAQAPALIDGEPLLAINGPPAIAGEYAAILGDGPAAVLTDTGVSGSVTDGNLAGDGCDPFDAGVSFAGRIVVFDEPPCIAGAALAAFYAESAGAAAVVIGGGAPGAFPDMAGLLANAEITIPYIGVEPQALADLRANLAAATVTVGRSEDRFVGGNQGLVRMHAPPTARQGTSVSHWTDIITPDLLMEPFLGEQAFSQVDLTVAALQDIGWELAPGAPGADVVFLDGFESAPQPSQQRLRRRPRSP